MVKKYKRTILILISPPSLSLSLSIVKGVVTFGEAAHSQIEWIRLQPDRKAP